MEFKSFTYIFLLLLFAVLPILTGVQKNFRVRIQLKSLIPALFFTGAIFSIWNIRFTEFNIWTYNPDYLIGIEFIRLPVEEWLSFVIIPLSSTIIYEAVKIRFQHFDKANAFLAISLILVVVFALLAYVFRQKLYSFFTFFLLAIYFGYTIFRNRFKKHLTYFYLSFFITLIPYILFCSILNSIPAKSYNLSQTLNAVIFNIPAENFGYLFLMLLMVTTIYENLKERRLF